MTSAIQNTIQATYMNTIANNHDILLNLTYDKAILAFGVIACIILLTAVIVACAFMFKTKSHKAVTEQKKKELEDKIDELKDGIKHREALMTSTNDESVRKMLRMQNDSDDLTVKDLEHKIDALLRH